MEGTSPEAATGVPVFVQPSDVLVHEVPSAPRTVHDSSGPADAQLPPQLDPPPPEPPPDDPNDPILRAAEAGALPQRQPRLPTARRRQEPDDAQATSNDVAALGTPAQQLARLRSISGPEADTLSVPAGEADKRGFGRTVSAVTVDPRRLHWPTDRQLIEQAIAAVEARTVDESRSYLVIDDVTVGENGIQVRAAADSCCGPTGVVAVELARRCDWLHKLEKVKPIHGVDGHGLRIYGRINGIKLYINSSHCITVDLLVCDMNIGAEILLGAPILKKYSFNLDMSTGKALFRDDDGTLAVFGRGVSQAFQVPAPDSAVASVGAPDLTIECDITAAIHVASAPDADTKAQRCRQRLEQILHACQVADRELHEDLVMFLAARGADVGSSAMLQSSLQYPGTSLTDAAQDACQRDGANDLSATSLPQLRIDDDGSPQADTFWALFSWRPADRARVKTFAQRLRTIARARRQAALALHQQSPSQGPPTTPVSDKVVAAAELGGESDELFEKGPPAHWFNDGKRPRDDRGGLDYKRLTHGELLWSADLVPCQRTVAGEDIDGNPVQRPAVSILNQKRCELRNHEWHSVPPTRLVAPLQNREYQPYKSQEADDQASPEHPADLNRLGRLGCDLHPRMIPSADQPAIGWHSSLVGNQLHAGTTTAGEWPDVMRMAMAAYAAYGGEMGPNRNTFSRPNSLGNPANRGSRYNRTEELYDYNAFQTFLRMSLEPQYAETDPYYRRVHLQGRLPPPGHRVPWHSAVRGDRKSREKRRQDEEWQDCFEGHTTISDVYAQVAGHRPAIKWNDTVREVQHRDVPRSWDEAYCVPYTPQSLRYSERRLEEGEAPQLRARDIPRQVRPPPPDMLAQAHLMDDAHDAPSTADVEVLQDHAAQATAPKSVSVNPSATAVVTSGENDATADLTPEPPRRRSPSAAPTAAETPLINTRALRARATEATVSVAAAVGDEEAWSAEDLELENVIQPEAAFAAEARDLEPDLEHYCLADPEFPGIRLRPTRDGDCAAAYVDEGIMALLESKAAAGDPLPLSEVIAAMKLKGDEGESRVHKVDGQYLSSPGATPEMIAGINRNYQGQEAADILSILKQTGITASFFEAEFSDWDLKHAVPVKLKPGESLPPPEYRRIGRGMIEAVAEQLRAFLKAGWIYRVTRADTAAPLVIVKKKSVPGQKPKIRVCIDYGALNKVLIPRAWAMPDVTETIHTVRDVATHSWSQIQANEKGERCTHSYDDPDRQLGSPAAEDPGASLLGVSDATKAFHRIAVAEEDQDKLAFAAPGLGIFTWRVLPMGLVNSPAAFCSVLVAMLRRASILYEPGINDPAATAEYFEELYADMQNNDWLIDGFELREINNQKQLYIDGQLAPSHYVLAYIDDLLLCAGAPKGAFGREGMETAMREHTRQWKLLIAVCRHQRLFLSEEKTVIGTEYLRYLGMIVSHDSIFADPDRVAAIAKVPEPKSKHDVRCFCGLTNFYSHFCELFAVLLKPIYALTTNEVQPDTDVTGHFTIPLPASDPDYDTHFAVLADEHLLTDQGYTGRKLEKPYPEAMSCRVAWQLVKDRLCELTLLAQPDPTKPMVVFTDSSQYAGAGAIATQVAPGKLRIFDVWSRGFTSAQRNYSASQRECLSIVVSCERWFDWLVTAEFEVRCMTDHSALQHARKGMNNARITSWMQRLQCLRFKIYYRPGTCPAMLVPDALSRLVQSTTEAELQKEWSKGEHWSTVPQFRPLFEQVYPDVTIHDAAPGTDTFEKPEAGISAVRPTSWAEAVRPVASAESDGDSDVFTEPDEWDAEHELNDDDEQAMAKFFDELIPAPELGGGARRAAAKTFFDDRQTASVQRVRPDVELRQEASLTDTVLGSAYQTRSKSRGLADQDPLAKPKPLQPHVHPDLNNPEELPKDEAQLRHPRAVTHKLKAPSAPTPEKAKGKLLDATHFRCVNNTTPEMIAARFDLDVHDLIKWNKEWSPKRYGNMKPQAKLRSSEVRLAPPGTDRVPGPPAEPETTVDPNRGLPSEAPDLTPVFSRSLHGPLATAEPTWKLTKKAYLDSKEFRDIYKSLMYKAEATPETKKWPKTKAGTATVIGSQAGDFCRAGKLLYYLDPVENHWRLVIPDEVSRRAILDEFHTVFQSHPSAGAMYRLMRQRVWWPSMARDCTLWCRRCDHCQRHKSRPRKAPGHLQPQPNPTDIGMYYHVDLITDLPPAGQLRYDAVLCIVDRGSRRTWLLPTHKTATSREIAEKFFSTIVCSESRGAPSKIYSDRGPQFRGEFYTYLNRLMHTKVALSSGHSHTGNGLAERHIASAETLLRGCGYDQSRWLAKLPLCVFSLNSLRRPSLGNRSPIEIETGRQPTMPLDLSPGVLKLKEEFPSISAYLDAQRLLRAEVMESMNKVELAMKGQYDNGRDSWGDTIKAGDKVWLESRDVSLAVDELQPSHKLRPRFYGPYEVLDYVNPRCVKLKFPAKSRVYPVFHLSKIKKYYGDDSKPEFVAVPEPCSGDFTVERILRHRVTAAGKTEFLVQWADYGLEDVEWVPEAQCAKAKQKVKEYWKRRKIVQAYQEEAKTDADLLVMAMLGTEDKQPPGDQMLVSECSLLSAGHRADVWTAQGCEVAPVASPGRHAHDDAPRAPTDVSPLDDEVTRSWDVSQPEWREHGHRAATRRPPSILRRPASRPRAVHAPPRGSGAEPRSLGK